MNAFNAGFARELLELANVVPLVKAAGLDDVGQKAGARAGRLLGGGIALGGLNKLMNPDVSLGEAMGSGLAVSGGGHAGHAIAKRFKGGRALQLGGGIAGAVLANKLVRSLMERKREDRARGELFDKESAARNRLGRLIANRFGFGDITPPPIQPIQGARRR